MAMAVPAATELPDEQPGLIAHGHVSMFQISHYLSWKIVTLSA